MGGLSRGDFVQDVRAAADIARLVSEYVSLKKAGRKLKGLCPFHNEKTPSFTVDPDKQLFFCFGCRTGGDIFKFYMLTEKVEFPDALRQLAVRHGVPIPRHAGGEGSETARVLEMHREAAAFYRATLASPQGAAARAYLERRGLGAETVKALGIGHAPDGWDGLKSRLRRAGFREEEIVRSGLAVERRGGGGSYDRFRNRLMFPIERVGGGIIGFGGRTLGDDEPKYLNSPETPVFHKGRHLYGLSWSREAIREAGVAILVEGYTDFAALWQAGIQNVAAVLGTGFTPEHGRLLGRFTSRAVINFDADRAGRDAADRAVSVLLEQDYDLQVLELPDGQDPDDFIVAHGAEAYRELAAGAPSFVEALLVRAAEGKDLSTPEGKARAAGEVLPRLAAVGNRVLRAAALSRVADRLDLPEEAVREEFRRIAPARRADEPPPPPARARQRPSRRITEAERRLLYLALNDAAARDRLLASAREEDFQGFACQRLFAAVLDQQRGGHPVTVEALEGIVETEDRERLLEIALGDFPGLVAADWEACWNALRREKLEEESRRLQRLLQQGTEETGQAAQIDELLRRKLELRRQIDALS